MININKNLASSSLQKRKIRVYFANIKTIFKYLIQFSILLFIFFKNHKVVTPLKNFFITSSTTLGLKIQEVEINGCQNFDVKNTLLKLKLNNMQSIFSIDLSKIKELLESDKWVRKAEIHRVFPNKLIINLEERRPIAVWQYGKKLYLIDETGYKITDNVQDFYDLLHFIGEGANIYAARLVKLLQDKPKMYPNIKYITLKGFRRWDLVFYDGMIVKMPEYNFQNALDFLYQQFFEETPPSIKIKILDMRNEEKYYIELH